MPGYKNGLQESPQNNQLTTFTKVWNVQNLEALIDLRKFFLNSKPDKMTNLALKNYCSLNLKVTQK